MSKRRRSVWFRHIGQLKRAAPWNSPKVWKAAIVGSYFPLGAIFGFLLKQHYPYAKFTQLIAGIILGIVLPLVPAWAARAIQKHHREARYVFPPGSKSDFIWIKPDWLDQATHDYHDRLTYDPFNHSADVNNNFYVYKRDDISAVYDQDRDN